MREINIYQNMESWLKETPNAVIKGTVKFRNDSFVEIYDENGFTQIINLNQLFAIVY